MTIGSVTVGGNIRFSNDAPFVLIGGMNVIEDEETRPSRGRSVRRR